MSTSPVINALTTKRADLARTVSDLERDLQQARTDLAHIDATIRMFDPSIKPFAIPAKNPAPSRSAHFEAGEIARRCREALRKAGASGVTAADIALEAMADKGIGADDAERQADFTKRMYWTLVRLGQDGVARKSGQGTSARWSLTL
jgi:hypothetical protein